MELTPVLKTGATPAQNALRPGPERAPVAPADLPPDKAVSALDRPDFARAADARRDTARSADAERSVADIRAAFKRSYARDASTDALVFKLTSDPDGEVLLQIPSEDALRLKAYLRDLAGAREDARPSVEREG